MISQAPTESFLPPPEPHGPGSHRITCANCASRFDAMAASWCSCLVTERTFVCPSCLRCFCQAPPAYKSRVWAGASRALWDRKFTEHHSPFVLPPNPPPETVRRPLVLFVDDEPDIRRVGANVIRALGYGMVSAANGAEGLELARLYEPDLVLTDALMPKLDGRDMCLRLKTDPATSGIRVVVMTALYTSVKYQTQGVRNYKADAYITKPVDVARLGAVLQSYLGA